MKDNDRMSLRQYSPQQMFLGMANAHQPRHAYRGQPFDVWKQEVQAKVLASLGRMPEAVDPSPELLRQWEHDGLVKQKWAVDVSPFASVEVQINRPAGRAGELLPAILCCHGHDAAGKEEIMGNAADAPETIFFGHTLAKQGFVTFAMDFMGKGLRHDGPAPGQRDWCNLYHLHAQLFGMTNLGINVCHARRVMDFVLTQPGVDARRLAVKGWSNGGTMALWLGLADPRFKAVEINSYSGSFADFAIHDLNYCGWQMTPGLFDLVDLPDLQGLLAPLPLLVDIGQADQCFKPAPSLACFEKLKAIYAAANASDRLTLNLNDGGHGSWSLETTLPFLNRFVCQG